MLLLFVAAVIATGIVLGAVLVTALEAEDYELDEDDVAEHGHPKGNVERIDSGR